MREVRAMWIEHLRLRVVVSGVGKRTMIQKVLIAPKKGLSQSVVIHIPHITEVFSINGNKNWQSRSLTNRCWLVLIKAWLQVHVYCASRWYGWTKDPGGLQDLIDGALCGLFLWHLLTLNSHNLEDERTNRTCYLWICHPYLHNSLTLRYLGVK